jgi:exonuclease SbcD
MKILHTSDWHLGQNFMGKSRKEEHEAFFSWLLEQIKVKKIDVLIVAGDIFDTGTPPNYALELYYNLLKQLSALSYLTTVITAGNHDSVATLNASKQLLKVLNIHVVTSGNKDEKQLVPIYENDKLRAVICAVPFLRDSMVRNAVGGEGSKDKEVLLNRGIKEHYEKLYKEAQSLASNNENVSILATGHLTTVGSRTSESERDIYIGGTLDIGSDFLGKEFDYVALGHLHHNQKVGVNNVRYSGSPIALSFSETKDSKKVNVVSFENNKVEVEELEIPIFQPLLLLKGNLEQVKEELAKIEDKRTWIEVQLQDDNPRYANQIIRELANTLQLTLLAVKIDKSEKTLDEQAFKVLSLDELSVTEVFEKRLELEALESNELKAELLLTFKKVVEKVENV